MNEPKLSMRFEANTIQHLGVKMYSTMPPALAELIANAYDACATEVYINLYDEHDKKVIVKDNGIGMSFDEINNYFLRIGRNRREEGQESKCGRVPTGKKGLGKLALFGIGEKINIATIQNQEEVSFDLDWDQIINTTGKDYEPAFKRFANKDSMTGTIITLTNLKRRSKFPLGDYVVSIAKLFDFQDDFTVYISLNDSEYIKINNKSKYQNVTPEFEWDIQDIVKVNTKNYSNKEKIQGKVITTEKPLNANIRGITLFANGRMVNAPEFFKPSESSHFYSYTTGWLNIDFIDNWDEDVISTNRQSIDWEHEETIHLREYLASCLSTIEVEWRESRKKKKKNKIKEQIDIDVEDWIDKLPDNAQRQVEGIINLLDDAPEISINTQNKAIELIHELVPEYANFHWRHLHLEIQKAAKEDYQRKDFYRAFTEAVKRYILSVKAKSSSKYNSDQSMMGAEFGHDRVLQVASRYSKSDGSKFDPDTYKCVEEGQKLLSMGVVSGARNPVSHEEIRELRESRLFTEKDCLDMLSLLSHLFRRLDDAEVNVKKTQ